MKTRRSGFTTMEIVLIIAVLVLLALGAVLWSRVSRLNTWAVKTDAWLTNSMYPWVKNNSFMTGPGGGNPDGTKPPPPPDGL